MNGAGAGMCEVVWGDLTLCSSAVSMKIDGSEEHHARMAGDMVFERARILGCGNNESPD